MSQPKLPIGLSAEDLQASLNMAAPLPALAKRIESIPRQSVVGQIIAIAGSFANRSQTGVSDGFTSDFLSAARTMGSASRALAELILTMPKVQQNAKNVVMAFFEVAINLRALLANLLTKI